MRTRFARAIRGSSLRRAVVPQRTLRAGCTNTVRNPTRIAERTFCRTRCDRTDLVTRTIGANREPFCASKFPKWTELARCKSPRRSEATYWAVCAIRGSSNFLPSHAVAVERNSSHTGCLNWIRNETSVGITYLTNVLLDPRSCACIAIRARCTALVLPNTATLAGLFVRVGYLS